MKITQIKIRKTFNDPAKAIRALVSITFDDVFVVHDLKVIQGHERLFVAMPSRCDTEGVYRDTAHPISQEFREEIEAAVMIAYSECLEGAE